MLEGGDNEWRAQNEENNPYGLARWQSVPNANGWGKSPSVETKRYLGRKVKERRKERRRRQRDDRQPRAVRLPVAAPARPPVHERNVRLSERSGVSNHL